MRTASASFILTLRSKDLEEKVPINFCLITFTTLLSHAKHANPESAKRTFRRIVPDGKRRARCSKLEVIRNGVQKTKKTFGFWLVTKCRYIGSCRNNGVLGIHKQSFNIDNYMADVIFLFGATL